MNTVLSLVEKREVERRTFPRFPFSFLTFKGLNQVFEVKEISYTGMRLVLKNGTHTYNEGQEIKGCIRWKGDSIEVKGSVKWRKDKSLGVFFEEKGSSRKKVNDFLNVTHIISCLKVIDTSLFDSSMTQQLSLWLRADGMAEVFVWRYPDGETKSFQIILMDSFLEWTDGVGVKTGKLSNNRNEDSPLTDLESWDFEFDSKANLPFVKSVKGLLEKVSEELIPKHIQQFLCMKL